MLCIVRTMLSKDICPSVRLSACPSHAGILSKFFSPSGSHTILVFLYQTFWRSLPPPANEGVECRRHMKNSDFWPISRFIGAMIQDMDTVTVECNQKTVPSFRIVPFSMTVNHSQHRFLGNAILWSWISQKRFENRDDSHKGMLIGTFTIRHTERCHFEWHWNDLEWLSEIFNDVKHRAVSLR